MESGDRLCHILAGLLILGTALFHVAYLAFICPLDLAPDEAHYWDWSRHLDWSYYSKGPLVAWMIRASCELVGPWSEANTGSLTFAVRLPAVICGALLLTSLYVLTIEVFGRPRLGLALLAGALTLPVITAGSTLMTIDSPYTCFWGWALVFAHRAVTRNDWGWEAAGLCIGLGILAKYTMIVFLPSLALFLLFSREHRRLLLSGGFWSMVGITALCCLPILIWNAQHDWVTFQHLLRLAGLAPRDLTAPTGPSLRPLGPLVYLGGQAALLLGFWLVAWFVAMAVYNPLRVRDAGVRFLWWLSAPMFLLFFAFSLKTDGGEINWPVTAYLSGGVLAAAWLWTCLNSEAAWLRWTTAFTLGIAATVGLTLTTLVHRSDWMHPLLDGVAGSPTPERPFPIRRFDPTCRLRGWRTLASRVDEIRQRLRDEGQEPVIAAHGWSLPGELGVYCAGHPPVYSVGILQGDRHSQYDYWPGPIERPKEYLGKSFLIVGGASDRVTAAFEYVEPVIWVKHEQDGRPLAGWTVHVGHGFKGFGEKPGVAPH